METINVDRPDAQKTRTELTLAELRRSWSTRVDGLRFYAAVYDFLSMRQNSNTQRVYAYSTLEFFGWLRARGGEIPTPDTITRADAARYAAYLSERDRGLEREWLAQDKSQEVYLAIYDIVAGSPGARSDAIRQMVAQRLPNEVVTRVSRDTGELQKLLRMDADFLDRTGSCFDEHLGCMVRAHILRREPSIADLRAGRVEIEGVLPEQREKLGIDIPIDPEIYRYYPVNRKGRPVERAGTVATRLNVLSSLWDHMVKSGENRPGAEALLKYNVWTETLVRTGEQARAQAKASRIAKTPDDEIFFNMLATTFVRQHGDGARQAAERFASGAVFGTWGSSFADLRDRLILLVLGQLGVRRSEVASLLRRDVKQEVPPLIVITGKRGKRRTVRLPPAVDAAYRDLTTRMRDTADSTKNEKVRSDLEFMLSDEAPMVPIIKNWGSNRANARTKPLSDYAIGMMLRRRAERAGYQVKTPEFARVHAHGFRHLFAGMAREAGTDTSIIQATLGHESAATTSIYTEERRPERLIARHLEPVRPPTPSIEAPPPAPATVLKRPRKAAGEEPAAVGAAPPEAAYRMKRQRLNAGLRGELAGSELAKVTANVEVERPSGLIFWAGLGGRLRPEMPIMSPRQAGECQRSGVCDRLAGLWSEWAETKGPTATFALIAWVHEALKLAQHTDELVRQLALERQFAELVEERRERGVPWSAERERERAFALVETRDLWAPPDASPGLDPDMVREHAADTIVNWFRDNAWHYHSSGGKAGEHMPLEALPDWFGDSDPVGALASEEREALLAWLLIQQGKQPKFEGPQKEAAEILEALCLYDMLIGEWKEERRQEKRTGRSEDEGVAMAKEALKEAAKKVHRVLRRYDPLFDVDTFTRQRADEYARWRALPPEERKNRDQPTHESSYLALIERFLGPAVAHDEAIVLLAGCSKKRAKVLDTDEMKDFFRVDMRAGTIVHRPEYAREFAKKFKQHSECVARRIARELWEIRKKKTTISANELQEIVGSMRSFRVPCPQALELELRERLGDWYGPLVFKEDWDDWLEQQKKQGARGGPELVGAPGARRQRALEGLSAEAAGVQLWTSAMFPERMRIETYKANARAFRIDPVVCLIMVQW